MGDWEDVWGRAARPEPGDEVDDMTLGELEVYVLEHPEMFVSEHELEELFGDLLSQNPNLIVPLAGRVVPLADEDIRGVKERIWNRLVGSGLMPAKPENN